MNGDSIRLRTVFFGTSHFAEAVFRALHGAHEVAAAVTRPARPAGRGHRTRPGRIREVADELGVPVLQPAGFRRERNVEAVTALRADCLVVADYGRILPPALLDSTPLGAVNVHASLLPALRGAAPAIWAVARGLKRTGVTTMLMDPGLDTGPILLQRALALGPADTGGSLLARLAPVGAQLLLETLEGLTEGRIEPTPQDDAAATEAPPVRKADAALDWTLDARALECRVRAFRPAPTAFTAFPDAAGEPRLLRIHAAAVGAESFPEEPGTFRQTGSRRDPGIEVACGGGVLLPLEVQEPGGGRMSVGDFVRGRHLPGLAEPGAPNRPPRRFLPAAEAAARVGPPGGDGSPAPRPAARPMTPAARRTKPAAEPAAP